MARKRSGEGTSGYTILVVDDQEDTLESVRLLLEREGHRVLTAASGPEAIALLGTEPVQVALVDYLMPRMTGGEVVARIREVAPTVQVILQTGYAGERPAREMLRRLDIHGYHDKAEGPEKLLLWIDVALRAHDQIERATRAERLKSEMLANVSHEFRTPVNIIIGYSDMLLEGGCGPQTEAGVETLGRLRASATRLQGLIAEFLDMSRLEAGAVGVELRPVRLAGLRAELDVMMERLIAGRPVRFDWTVDDALAVLADASKLRVILCNLLHNAAKFTERGDIRVEATARGNEVVVTVHDTGRGIEPGDHEAIFEAFRQTSAVESSGTGLGLTIARQLARLMGGDVTVESRLGTGAAFAVRLRQAPGRLEEALAKSAA